MTQLRIMGFPRDSSARNRHSSGMLADTAAAGGTTVSMPMADVPTTGELDLEERSSFRRISGSSDIYATDQDDGYDVEYRKLRLERVILVGVWTEGTTAEIEATMRELAALAQTAGSEVVDMLYQKTRPARPRHLHWVR